MKLVSLVSHWGSTSKSLFILSELHSKTKLLQMHKRMKGQWEDLLNAISMDEEPLTEMFRKVQVVI